MRKILIVTDAWHPQVNGVVRVFSRVCELLEAQGYAISIIEPSQFHSIPLPFYPEIRLSLLPRKEIRRRIKEYAPDAIHIATEGPLGVAARALCIQQGRVFTTSYHTHFQLHLEARIGGLFTPLLYVWLRWFHRPAAHTMVATEHLKQDLEGHGFTHLVVWPLGVDTHLFTRNPHSTLPALPQPVFVYFGRLAPEKSVEEFLTAKLPGTKLIIGDGPSRAHLEKMYGDQAQFVGYKQGAELIDWLSLCTVCVFPSRTETFGLVIIEALSMGLPVAAHPVMGPQDIITQGVDGYLNENLTTAALACVALSPTDCRNTALRYSWEHSIESFLRNLIFNT